VAEMIKKEDGLTLVEVLTAVAIFTFFITAFVISQGQNLSDSANLRDEIMIKRIAENVINEIIVHPPELKDSLALTPEKKSVESNPDYVYTLTWKKFEVPDFNKLSGASGEESEEDKAQSQANGKLFEIFKKNAEKLLWQLEVTVKNKETGFSYTITSWIYNPDAKVKIEGL
jgi:type II secretion system protein I